MDRTRLGVWAVILLAGVGCVHGTRSGMADDLGEGRASYYGPGLHGRLTASGERFDKNGLTAAHRTLRFGTCVDVENLDNGLRVKVRVNDRGPYAGGRILDVSEGAARQLRMLEAGVARVRLRRC